MKEPPDLWVPLLTAIARSIEELESEECMEFRLQLLLGNVGATPCIRAQLQERGHLLVELHAGERGNPTFSAVQRAWLQTLRWLPSEQSSSRYTKIISGRNDKDLVAIQIVVMLKKVFNVQKDAWFKLTCGEEGVATVHAGLWHYPADTNIVCLPNQNPQHTLEGLLIS